MNRYLFKIFIFSGGDFCGIYQHIPYFVPLFEIIAIFEFIFSVILAKPLNRRINETCPVKLVTKNHVSAQFRTFAYINVRAGARTKAFLKNKCLSDESLRISTLQQNPKK